MSNIIVEGNIILEEEDSEFIDKPKKENSLNTTVNVHDQDKSPLEEPKIQMISKRVQKKLFEEEDVGEVGEWEFKTSKEKHNPNDNEFDFENTKKPASHPSQNQTSLIEIKRVKVSDVSSKDLKKRQGPIINNLKQKAFMLKSTDQKGIQEEEKRSEITSEGILVKNKNISSTIQNFKNQIDLEDEWDQLTKENIAKVQEKIEISNSIPKFVSYIEFLTHLKELNLEKEKRIINKSSNSKLFVKRLLRFCRGPQLTIEMLNEKDQFLAFSLVQFDEKTPIHYLALSTIYKALTYSDVCPRFGGHWKNIGFQNIDPATDLRGVGMLGVFQIFALSHLHKSLFLAMFEYSKIEKFEFPLCCVLFGITGIVIDVLKEERINSYISEQRSLINAANNFFFALTFKLFMTYKANEMTIKDFHEVKKITRAAAFSQPKALIQAFNNDLPSFLKVCKERYCKKSGHRKMNGKIKDKSKNKETIKGKTQEGVDTFFGRYMFSEDPTVPNLSGIMQICCERYLHICGHPLEIKADPKNAQNALISIHGYDRFECQSYKTPKPSTLLSCMKASGKLGNTINIDENLNLFSTHSVSDQNYQPFQCQGKLIRLFEVGKPKKSSLMNTLSEIKTEESQNSETDKEPITKEANESTDQESNTSESNSNVINEKIEKTEKEVEKAVDTPIEPEKENIADTKKLFFEKKAEKIENHDINCITNIKLDPIKSELVERAKPRDRPIYKLDALKSLVEMQEKGRKSERIYARSKVSFPLKRVSIIQNLSSVIPLQNTPSPLISMQIQTNNTNSQFDEKQIYKNFQPQQNFQIIERVNQNNAYQYSNYQPPSANSQSNNNFAMNRNPPIYSQGMETKRLDTLRFAKSNKRKVIAIARGN